MTIDEQHKIAPIKKRKKNGTKRAFKFECTFCGGQAVITNQIGGLVYFNHCKPADPNCEPSKCTENVIYHGDFKRRFGIEPPARCNSPTLAQMDGVKVKTIVGDKNGRKYRFREPPYEVLARQGKISKRQANAAEKYDELFHNTEKTPKRGFADPKVDSSPNPSAGIEIVISRVERLAKCTIGLEARHRAAIEKVIEKKNYPSSGVHSRIGARILADLCDGLDIIEKNIGG